MRPGLRAVSAVTIVAGYAFYFLEWLFFFTKPSMFSAMSAWDSFRVLLISPIPLIFSCLLLIALIGLFGKIPGRVSSSNLPGKVALLIPAFIMAATAFLLIENFTYTLFSFNVGSFDGPARYCYALIFLVLTGLFFRYLKTALFRASRIEKRKAINLLIYVSLSISVLATLVQFEGQQDGSLENQGILDRKLPNILILSTDGLVADRMSAYGYYRDTTPFIKSLLDDALIFENSFTNSEKTTGSVASLLSGRLPTTTGVLIRPDTFQGEDSFRHLPGMLKNLGYRTADISIRYYADAYDLNMRGAFDYANGRRISERMVYSRLPLSVQQSYASELRFIEETSERIWMRLLHAVGLAEMINPYDEVKELKGKPGELYGNDVNRVGNLLKFVDESDTPFFAHIHLMVTHGPWFFPRERTFSIGQQQQIFRDPFKVGLPMVEHHQLRELDWMDDFYDDATLDFDRYTREIFQHLKQEGKLEETLIVLTSDHGVVRSSHERLPLIIWSPELHHKGRVTSNTQRIDIAPTILDFLGLAPPEWMEGESLLDGSINATRPVFSVGVNMEDIESVDGWWGNVKSEAPFYSLGSLSMVHCQNWYFMSLENGLMTSQEVEGHSSPCLDSELMTMPQARKLMVEHLTQRGYEAEFLLDGTISCNDAMYGSKLEKGVCFYDTGEFKRALSMFQSVADDDPQNDFIHNNICATLNKLTQYQKGIEACKKAIELRPDFGLAQNNLAWAENELAKARTSAREKENEANDKNDVYAFRVAGQVFYGVGDYHDSLRCWEKALALEPDNPDNMNNVAMALIALKQHERAIEVLKTAVSKDPDNALYQNNIDWARSLLNDAVH